MNTQQALQVIKNTLDEALKVGAIKTIEHANAIIQAFSVLQNAVNKNDATAN